MLIPFGASAIARSVRRDEAISFLMVLGIALPSGLDTPLRGYSTSGSQ